MAVLVSPGVSVTVTDESFYVPVMATTVPLFFIATEYEKTTYPTNSILASGTVESNVLRTVTSVKQMIDLYGVPKFQYDARNRAQHGDARNEYGLFGVYQFLANAGSRAYVVRADVDLGEKDKQMKVAAVSNIFGNSTASATPLPANNGDGQVANLLALNSDEEQWNIVFSDATTFSVTGSVSGASLAGTVGDAYDNGSISFQINDGVVPFDTGDGFIIITSNDNENKGELLDLEVNNKRPLAFNRYIVEAADDAGALAYNVYELAADDLRIKINTSPIPATTSFDNGYLRLQGITSSSTKPLVRANGMIPGDYWYLDPNTTTEAIFFGTGVGSMLGLNINYQVAFAETWEIRFTSATSFTVTGSMTGVDASGIVGQPYNNGKISFEIEAGTSDFSVGEGFDIEITDDMVEQSLGQSDVQKRQSIVTALQACINSNEDVRSESVEFNLILCPGYHEVVDEMLLLSRYVKDEAFVLADTPMNKNADDVVTWGKTSARQRSNMVAYYYPHGLASNIDGRDVVCAASGIALATIAYSDSVSEVWFAPAGLRRGVTVGISKVGYVSGLIGTSTTFNELVLNQGQRDALYEFGSDINPIVFFPGRGIVVWGQKTSASAASAMDRINVARMMAFIKRSLRKSAMPFVFELNDPITRGNLKAMVDGFLTDIMVRRGLYDFISLCDESNNTPTVIDRNELVCEVLVKPAKVAEFIHIPITIVSTGADI